MLDTVRKLIADNKLLVAGEKVLVACSGGCDSMVLLHILYRLKDELGFSLAAANLNHMLRPEAADEALIIADFCSKLDIPYYSQAIDVQTFSKQSGRSIQDAARHKRYEYLRKTAAELGGAKIATGHHRDDQAETVLLHLLRGSGSGGLGGIELCASGIIRPLLFVSRAEIENYCAENNLPICQDMSNFKTDYLRNRIRLKLIPLLEDEYNNKIKKTLVKTAEIVSSEHDFIKQTALEHWPQTVNTESEAWRLNLELFNKLHLAVKRELVRRLIEKKQGTLTGISFFHVENLLSMAVCGQVGSVLTLPGRLIAKKTYDELIFIKNPVRTYLKKKEFEKTKPIFKELAAPGITKIPELALEVSLKIYSCENLPKQTAGIGSCLTAVFDYDELKPPFTVRTRLSGDRFEPSGMKGSKKLKDFFIDEKIPQKTRDFVPLFSDQKGIIWVAGYRRANRGKINPHTKKFLQITVTKVTKRKEL